MRIARSQRNPIRFRRRRSFAKRRDEDPAKLYAGARVERHPTAIATELRLSSDSVTRYCRNRLIRSEPAKAALAKIFDPPLARA